MNAIVIPAEYVTMAALGTTVMSYLWLQYIALRYWEGMAGWMAGLPIIIWALCLQSLFYELRLDPASHNLWAFEIALWTVGAAAGLFIISWFQKPVVRKRKRKKRVVHTQAAVVAPAVAPIETGTKPAWPVRTSPPDAVHGSGARAGPNAFAFGIAVSANNP